MDKQIINMPMQLAFFGFSQAQVAGNASGDPPACASYINVFPGWKGNALERPWLQTHGSLQNQAKQVGAFFDHILHRNGSIL